MDHRFFTMDVFTTTRFQGNPLAVITDGDGFSQDQMLAIAREMNLSETVFVQRPTNDRALARLRIFTTKEELKLAGHPVIGTWFLLAELGVVPAQEGGVHVLQQTGAGILPVEIRFKDGRPQRVTMTQKEAIFKPSKVDQKKLAAALGLTPKDFDPKLPPEFVSTGIFNLMVPLRNRSGSRENRNEHGGIGAADRQTGRARLLLRAWQWHGRFCSGDDALGTLRRCRHRIGGGLAWSVSREARQAGRGPHIACLARSGDGTPQRN